MYIHQIRNFQIQTACELAFTHFPVRYIDIDSENNLKDNNKNILTSDIDSRAVYARPYIIESRVLCTYVFNNLALIKLASNCADPTFLSVFNDVSIIDGCEPDLQIDMSVPMYLAIGLVERFFVSLFLSFVFFFIVSTVS